MELTKEQQTAISQISGDLQLIACAGSGKTEVVALRIANLLAPKNEKGGALLPSNIVAFTFTEKAAAELKKRVTEKCRERLPNLVGLAEMYIGTIHGFCLDILKTEVPTFLKYDVLDEIQQTLLVDRNSKKSGLTEAETLDGQKLKRFVDTALYAQAMSILRESKLNLKALKGNKVYDGLNKYSGLLHEKGYLDYSAIMDEAVRALTTDTNLQKRFKDRIKVVIVDEYQDVNPIQETLIQLLHELGANVTVVGDDDQTIYQWRGSDVENIKTFTSRYNGAGTAKLQKNFRSTVGITDVARIVIEKNSDRLPKSMQSAEQQLYEPGDIVALQFSSPKEEAEYIAQSCKDLYGTFINDGDKKRAISWSEHGSSDPGQCLWRAHQGGAAEGRDSSCLSWNEYTF